MGRQNLAAAKMIVDQSGKVIARLKHSNKQVYPQFVVEADAPTRYGNLIAGLNTKIKRGLTVGGSRITTYYSQRDQNAIYDFLLQQSGGGLLLLCD